jgi:hypothetical protein
MRQDPEFRMVWVLVSAIIMAMLLGAIWFLFNLEVP